MFIIDNSDKKRFGVAMCQEMYQTGGKERESRGLCEE